MSSLGQMIAGIAHEINNPVSFVYSNLVPAYEYAQELIELLEIYQEYFSNPPQIIVNKIADIDLDFVKKDFIKLINSMQVGTERIAQIVSSLRNFSRLDEAEVKQVDIAEGIDNTLMILGNRLKNRKDYPDIEVIKEYEELPLVECYAGQLNQVFMNILANAVDALDENNLHRIHNDLPPQVDIIKICVQRLDDRSVEIHIIDNASGISSEIHSKIFDPFFTTKDVGKGTGLGLSICYQIIVDQHAGNLSFHSIPGEGTEFIIKIPISCNQAIDK